MFNFHSTIRMKIKELMIGITKLDLMWLVAPISDPSPAGDLMGGDHPLCQWTQVGTVVAQVCIWDVTSGEVELDVYQLLDNR